MNGNEEQKTIDKKVNLVIIEDTDLLAYVWAEVARKAGKEVDVYYGRSEFLENRQKYAKDTTMIITYGFNKTPNGVEVARILFAEGYTKLYLATGLELKYIHKIENIPSYLTVLLKVDDTDKIIKVLRE